MTQAYAQGDVDRLESLARRALPHWDLPGDAETRLLNLSENATFSVTPPAGDRSVILRVGRPDYSSLPEVTSELAWMEALAAERVVRTAPVLRTVDDHTAVEMSTSDLPRPRPCVAFGFVPGEAAPEEGDLTAAFQTLGGLAARLHRHARAWQPPAGFRRRRWDYETTIGERGIWRWQDAIGVSADGFRVLSELEKLLASRLERYGQGHDRFGLVHADLRLANVLFDGPDSLYVIDFDDCGWSWFMYDLAACLTFIEDRPDVPRLVDAWLAGYRTVAPLAAHAEDIIPTMIMLRRLLVLAWLGSHAETPVAQEEGAAYTEGTCRLAERYIQGDGEATDGADLGCIVRAADESRHMSEAGTRRQAAKAEAERVRRQILDDLQDGALAPGQRLGSERALAERFGVSRSTLRLALDSLERSGVVRRMPGRSGGTFVHQSKVERDLSMIAGLPEYLRRAGYVAGTPSDLRLAASGRRDLCQPSGARARCTDLRPAPSPFGQLGATISLEHAMLPAVRVSRSAGPVS